MSESKQPESNNEVHSKASRLTRRQFIGSTAATAAAATIVPSHVLGGPGRTAPSDKVYFLQIGCGGKGNADRGGMQSAGAKLVGMCDPDKQRAKGAFKKNPNVPKFNDYRRMLDKLAAKADAVTITTPDHGHGVQGTAAIQQGLHAYIQKPLARTYDECEVLMREAKRQGVVVQMGNQGHSGKGLKLWQQMYDAGVFGEVQRAEVWSARPGNWWPQGMKSKPSPESVPDHLSWDDWIGPQSMREYSPAYAPFDWRGWWDFGCGAIGDMACHNADPAFWILNLGAPSKITAKASSPAGVAYPNWSIVEFEFPGDQNVTGKPLTLTWYDGGKKPETPDGAHPKLKMGNEGCMVVGSDMAVKGGSHAGPPNPVAIPGQKFGGPVKEAEQHWRQKLKQISVRSHYENFVNAVKAGDPNKASSEVSYAAPLTQVAVMGCIATRYPGQTLQWDRKQKQFTNHREANQWLRFDPRSGYKL